jgi:hypothetical protein
MATSFTKRRTEDLISMFTEAASANGAFLAARDPKRANLKFDQMTRIYRELRNRGAQAQRQLLPLLNSENAHVRLHAATYALDFEPESGEEVLKDILQTERGSLGFTAQMTLEQWSKGELRFSWV